MDPDGWQSRPPTSIGASMEDIMIPLLNDYPNQAVKHYMDSRVKYTPDASKLFQYRRVLLFVCDGHQSKHREFPKLLKYGPTLFPGFTDYPTVFTMSGFNLFHDTESGQVVPLHADSDGFYPCAKIKGQLHLVTPDLIHSLDIHYQNGVQYRRRQVRLILPHRPKLKGPWKTLNGKPLPRALQGWRQKEGAERIHILKDVYMYVGSKKYWEPHLDGGYRTLQCPIQFPNKEKNWLPRYYEYTRTFEAQREDR
jgi:hypothetical protein